jgi:hypothetical protein
MLMKLIDNAEPGKPMRMMAKLLAERGFDIRGPEHEESRRLTITNARSARCEIGIHDDQGIVWEYFPWSGSDTEPDEISCMVLRILGADKNQPASLDTRPVTTLKGAVARRTNARGLKADLDVYEDRELYDVVAEVVLTNPAKPERGVVRVTDDGVIFWECDYTEMPEGAIAIADTTADVVVSQGQVSTSL